MTGWPLLLMPLLLLLSLPPLLILLAALALACVYVALPWLGLAGIVLEVRRGRVHWLWLTPVIGVFVGYYAIFAWENLRYTVELRERAEANAGLRIDFDPTRQALVAPLYPAGELVSSYGVPVAFIGNPLDHAAPLLSRRYIDDALCGELSERLERPARRIEIYRPRLGQNEPCLLIMPEQPDLPVIRISCGENSMRR